MNFSWRKRLSGISLLLVLIVAGCGGVNVTGSNTTPGGSETSTTSSKGENASSSNEDTGETIYLYGNDFVDIVAPEFAKQTGFKIEAVHYGGGEALAKIEAEQGNPQWDVVMMDGHGSIRNLADRGFLMTDWVPDNIGNLSDYGASLIPEDHAYTPITIHASAVIAYNTNRLTKEQAPKSWDDFFKYDGNAGQADPAVAAPAYPVVSSLFHHWGISDAEQKYSQMMDKGLRVYPKNGPLGSALVSGEIDIAALQESNAYDLKLSGEPVDIIWPEEGAPGSLRVAAISKHTKNPAAAKAFIEFMLKPETQQMLASLASSDSFFTPLVQGVVPRKDRELNPTFMIPPAVWAAEHEVEIKTWFADQNVK
ncbi:ABC transporter substrate-binding protein [Paenibacillus pabuli]|uniref:ABC transporter substrate-binding protein n=1 Tax=Paenibacillus pabuli TaxID=1472 RepID=UPI003CF0195B